MDKKKRDFISRFFFVLLYYLLVTQSGQGDVTLRPSWAAIVVSAFSYLIVPSGLVPTLWKDAKLLMNHLVLILNNIISL